MTNCDWSTYSTTCHKSDSPIERLNLSSYGEALSSCRLTSGVGSTAQHSLTKSTGKHKMLSADNFQVSDSSHEKLLFSVLEQSTKMRLFSNNIFHIEVQCKAMISRKVHSIIVVHFVIIFHALVLKSQKCQLAKHCNYMAETKQRQFSCVFLFPSTHQNYWQFIHSKRM